MAGYLGMIGVSAALVKGATKGGSYKGIITLSQTIVLEQMLDLVDNGALLNLNNLEPEYSLLEPKGLRKNR
jgi:hypothetical protein